MNNMQLYPVHPVITNNKDLATSYNSDPMSALMVSACITADEATHLIQNGAKFESIFIIDDVGRGVADRLARGQTGVHHVSQSASGDLSVSTIHSLIRAEFTDAGMG